MKKVYLLLFLLECFSSIYAQQDAEGWTILDPTKTDKVIYVSSSSGNDSTGVVYILPSSSIGNNPFLPDGSIRAFKTVEAAVSGIGNGEAVWVLLKRGDTFTTGIPPISGKSTAEPFLYSSYGTSSKPPLLKTGAESGISHCCRTLENFWIVGLSFYAHTRDPESPDYISDAGSRGIYLEAHKGHRLTNILLEGNVIRYYKDNVIQAFTGTGIVKDITLRRNMILDGYNNAQADNESIGLFAQNVDGFLLEENIFDHNGWLIPSYGTSEASDRTNGQATKFSHSTYFVDTQNVIFRNNSFNRPSNMATKWLATDTGSSENITVSNNLFNDCEIAVSMGTNYREGSYRYKNMNVSDNIMVDQGLSNPTRRDLSWGIEINDWDKGRFTNNILTSQETPTKSGFGIGISGETREVTIAGNIIYDLKDRRGILISHSGAYENIEFIENSFTYFADFKRFVRLEKVDFQGLSFTKNTYTNANNYRNSFYILDRDYQFNEWTQLLPNEEANIALPDYPDPSRDLDRYITEVLGLDSREAYYEELRKQNIHNWRAAYSGGSIAQWIRNGFRTDAHIDSEPPIPDADSLPDITGQCSVKFISIPTATDVISGNVQGVPSSSFPLTKSTTLHWYFTDEAGNTSSQEQKVIIIDTETPKLNVQNLPDLNGMCSVVITDIPTATDTCEGVIQGTPNVEIGLPISESTLITWSFTDEAGNEVEQTQRVVISESDVLTLDVQNLPDLKGDCSVVIAAIPTATIGCNRTVQGITDVDINEPITKSTIINWYYNNGEGNNISQQQRIIVEDVAPPIPVVASLSDLQGICSIDSIDFPKAYDGCEGIIMGIPNLQFPITDEHVKEIIWTYIDSNNNSTSQVQKVSLSRTEVCILEEVELSDFEIEMFQETCASKEDGSISVKALKPMEYTAKISNTSGYEEVVFFDELFTVTDLSPGDYTICFFAAERDFELCQTIALVPAAELMVSVRVDEENKKAILDITGSNGYTVILNGVSSTGSSGQVQLDLKTGDNKIEVHDEKECQDSFIATIFLSELTTPSKKLAIYPNPVSDGLLRISLRDLDFTPYQFNIATMSGKVIKIFDDFSDSQDEVVINVSELVQGTYIIQGVLADRIYSARFIKI